MITIERKERAEFVSSWKLRGKFSDIASLSKEMNGTPVPNGSSFFAIDTGQYAFYDAEDEKWIVFNPKPKSYSDLTDKPTIEGTPVEGDLELDDIGIGTMTEEQILMLFSDP